MLFEFYRIEEIIENSTEIQYVGILDNSKSSKILKSIESFVESNVEKIGDRKRVYNVAVDMLQGITNFRNTNSDKVEFYFKHDQHKIYLITKNMISQQSKDKLAKTLDYLNALSHDKEQLKQLYKRIMREGRLSDRGGPSLGLIDMVRKSQNKILYNFQVHDLEYDKFTMIIQFNID